MLKVIPYTNHVVQAATCGDWNECHTIGGGQCGRGRVCGTCADGADGCTETDDINELCECDGGGGDDDDEYGDADFIRGEFAQQGYREVREEEHERKGDAHTHGVKYRSGYGQHRAQPYHQHQDRVAGQDAVEKIIY